MNGDEVTTMNERHANNAERPAPRSPRHAIPVLLGALILVLAPWRSCRADPPPQVIPAGPLEPLAFPRTLPSGAAPAAPSGKKDEPARKAPPPSTKDKDEDKPTEPKTDRFPWPPVYVGADAGLPPPAQTCPIDFCTALRLAETDNPTIGISRQAIQEALAEQLRADVLLLPSVRAGVNYHKHNGVLQSSFGEMRMVDSSDLYAGGGARALAAETVSFPMVQIVSPLADAFLEPLVARRLVAVRGSQSEAASNQILLEVARRFLELVSAEAERGALRKSEDELGEIAKLTASFARAGQGRDADAHRARAEALLLHTEVQHAEERVAVASANLAELLNLDTAVRLQSPAQATGLLQLVDPAVDLDSLVRQAQAARPELAAASAEIARRDALVKQEKVRPWLPTISLGASTGIFGGGTNRTDLVTTNPSFARFSNRSDVDLMAFWTVENLGVGNHARQKERLAQREEAAQEQVRLLNQIRREVAAAYLQTKAALCRFDIAHRQLQTAEDGYSADLRRIRGGKGLPIEVLNSANRLVGARRNLVQSILEYNLSQFELFVAVGSRPTGACLPR
jgi:outer membrane protein TolC